jgi:hypothetical protein
MSLLLQSDLSSANKSKAITSLTNDIDDSKKLLASVENFISGSTEHLKGESFDAVRTHMQVYVDALNKRINCAENMIAAIKSANSTMTSFMDGESKLDTSETETVRNQMTAYNSAANSYLGRYNNYDSVVERISRESLYNLYNEALGNAKKKEKILKLLEQLDSKDAATLATLNSSTDDVSSFKTAVGSISSIKV